MLHVVNYGAMSHDLQRQPGDYAKMLRGQPDAVAFNSYASQYLYAPLHVRAGQPVRIWVLDASAPGR